MRRILSALSVPLILGLSLSAPAAVTGQWDFNSSNFVATVGADLQAQGIAVTDTAFGTTMAFGIPNIGGAVAQVMRFPLMPTSADGFEMFPGAEANGSTGDVNQYSLIMDILYPSASTGYRSLFQTSAGNSNDGDWFVNGDNGLGISGSYHGNLTPDTWHRIALVVDLEQTDATKKYLNYMDGSFVGYSDLGTAGNPGGRFSAYPASSGTPSWILSDNDGETALGYVNSIQFHDVALSAADIFALGGPSAAGIPGTIPVLTNLVVTVSPTNQADVAGMASIYFTASAVGSGTITYQWYRNNALLSGQTDAPLRLSNLQAADAGNYAVVVNNGLQSVTSSPPAVLTVNPAPAAIVTGQWDFNQSNLLATAGQPLQYFDATVQADTSFGTTTSFGISDIAGQPANVMYFAPSVGSWGGYIMTHGIAPNGGGTNVNQYTLIIDLLSPSSSTAYRALWQTDPSNTDIDADAFINPANGVGISQQYDGEVTPEIWHRVVLAFDLTKRELGKYLDGVNLLTAPVGATPHGIHFAQYLSASLDPLAGGGVDLRWSLLPTALLLADQDGDLAPMYVSSVQIRNGRMTDAAVAALGPPTANKIPQPATIQVKRSGTSIVIDWSGSALEGSQTATGGWAEIAGASHPYVITSPTGNQFFRAR
jgi:hypothetical protein